MEDVPRHYTAWINIWDYKLLYSLIYGGVTAYSTTDFIKVNGFSNEYWGWGGEDDDLRLRTQASGFEIVRPNETVTRYKMMEHKHEKNNARNKARWKLTKNFSNHWQNDGLSNLKYDVLSKTVFTFYINITVDLRYSDRLPQFILLN